MSIIYKNATADPLWLCSSTSVRLLVICWANTSVSGRLSQCTKLFLSWVWLAMPAANNNINFTQRQSTQFQLFLKHKRSGYERQIILTFGMWHARAQFTEPPRFQQVRTMKNQPSTPPRTNLPNHILFYTTAFHQPKVWTFHPMLGRSVARSASSNLLDSMDFTQLNLFISINCRYCIELSIEWILSRQKLLHLQIEQRLSSAVSETFHQCIMPRRDYEFMQCPMCSCLVCTVWYCIFDRSSGVIAVRRVRNRSEQIIWGRRYGFSRRGVGRWLPLRTIISAF